MKICNCTLLIIFIFFHSVQFSYQQPTPSQRRIHEFLYNRGFARALRNAKYPTSPPPIFATLRKLVGQEYVPLDANTTLVKKGSFTVGWNDGHWVQNLYDVHGKKSVYDHKLRRVTELDDQFSWLMGTNVQAPDNVPEDSSSSRRSSSDSDDDDEIESMLRNTRNIIRNNIHKGNIDNPSKRHRVDDG